MSQPLPPPVDFTAIVQTLRRHPLRWTVPMVVLTLVAAAYAVFTPAQWEASQALLVRDEASGSPNKPGRFADPDARRTAQETILELAKNRGVLAAALAQVGAPAGTVPAAEWPSIGDVESAQGRIRVVAPNGAEFGQTEMFYLKVTDIDAERAKALASAICDQVEIRLQQLRDHTARSLSDELAKTVGVAQADLDAATARLAAMESEVGADLGELRILNESASGESNLRMTLIQVKNELRQVELADDVNRQLLTVVEAARRDPVHLVAASNTLLDAQPSLRRLKDGLVDSQLLTARLLGLFTTEHPRVQAAVAAEDEVRKHLHGELAVAARGIESEIHLGARRVESLQNQLAQVNARLDRLAAMRAEYGNLVEDVRQRTDILKTAQTELADARASQAAAHAASLVTRMDAPTTGEHPIGPRKAIVVLVGLVGGLATGFGLVFLTAPSTLASVESLAGLVLPPAALHNGHASGNGHAAGNGHSVGHDLPGKDHAPAFGLSLKEALAHVSKRAPSRN
jgi:succinoglycan biosynthesis transport protein ExoP